MPSTFRLQVITPERAFWDDPVEMVVFQAGDGEMGILAGHAPMVSSLTIGEVRLKKDDAWQEFAASDGFVIVEEERVLLMVQTAEWPHEIDRNRARQQQEAALESMRQKKSMEEYYAARAMLTRAMVRLQVSGRDEGKM